MYSQGISKYYNFIHQAENYILQNKVDSSIYYYVKAESIHPLFDFDFHNLVISFCEKEKINLTTDEFKKLEKLYGLQQYIKWEEIKKYIRNKDFEGLFYQYNKIKNQHILIYNLFKEVIEHDQHVRDSCFKISHDAYRHSVLGKIIRQRDSMNALKLNEYLVKNHSLMISGERNEIGKAILLVTLHSNAWGQNILMPTLYNKVMNGTFDNRFYAYLVDRMCDNNKMDCTEGTYYFQRVVFYCSYTYLNENDVFIKTINDRRKIIGLDILEKYYDKILFIENHNGYERGYRFYNYDVIQLNKNTCDKIKKENEVKYKVVKRYGVNIQ